MTSRAAWRLIAERLADPAYHLEHGLCREVQKLYVERRIPLHRYVGMYSHILLHLESTPPMAWAYPAGEEREARLLAALFFAEGA